MLDKMTNLAVDVAKKAGSLLKEGFGTSFEIQAKDGRHDLVTEYDKKSEKLIIDEISKAFPSHSFLAEESGTSGEKGDIQWIIDPLDGTVNFAHGIPFFSVSIAAYDHKEVVLGVVYAPMLGELFVAKKGHGAYLNGKKLSVTKTKELQKCIVATGFPYNIQENPFHCIDQFTHIAKLGIPIRRMGSAAIDLSYIAAGRFDAFWEVVLNPWDFAAGLLLVTEAGGHITNLEGQPIDVEQRSSIVATNEVLKPIVLKHLSNYQDLI